MTIGDIILCGGLLLWAAWAVRSLLRQKKEGKCAGCGRGSCDGCGGKRNTATNA